MPNLKQTGAIKSSVLLIKAMTMRKKIIPPAANAEIDAMAELAKSENIAELVRLTMLFSGLMKRKFDELK